MQSDADFCAFAEQAGFTKGRFEAALPGQLRALQCIIAGVDLLAILPCGGGKTLLFVLPALQHTDGLTVIVSPLIALIEKMVGDLQAQLGDGIAMHCPAGDWIDDPRGDDGDDDVSHTDIMHARTALLEAGGDDFSAGSLEARMVERDSGLRFVFFTPEQLVDPVPPVQSQRALAAVRRRRRAIARVCGDDRLDRIVFDEAHTVAHWAWRESLGRLGTELVAPLQCLRPNARPPPILALTGTADARMEPAIAESLRFRAGYKVVREPLDRKNLRMMVLHITSQEGDYSEILVAGAKAALALVVATIEGGHGIIYVHKRTDSMRLADLLAELGYPAFPYHAGLDRHTRSRNLRAWQDTSSAWLVGTLAASLGIDCPDVRAVVHLAFRRDVRDFWQEMSRGGRDHRGAQCVAVWHPILLAPIGFHADLAPGSRAQGELSQMLRVLVRRDGPCRRQGLLPLLGEPAPERPCGACDVCCPDMLEAEEPGTTPCDVSDAAQVLLNAISHAQQAGRSLPYLRTLRYGRWRRDLSASLAYSLISKLLVADVVRLGHAQAAQARAATMGRWATLEINEVAALPIREGHEPVVVTVHSASSD